jgi:3-deoxy-D-manno-octulosonic-acid transferase
MLLTLYRTATRLSGPLIEAHLRRRVRRGKEDPERLGERLGQPGLARPAGRLVWLHAASVGESLAALPLIEALQAADPDRRILLTTGTVTSSTLMATRLPDGVIHQFVPVDRPSAWRRFLGHWQPALGLLIESEIWPNLVLEAEAFGLPLVLVNGRMSARSFARWRRAGAGGGALFARFALCLAKSPADGERFRALGIRDVQEVGNLKQAAAPLPIDPEAREALDAAIGDRPVWLAASTHPGEELLLADCHRHLAAAFPDLLTVIVPRHPERGPGLAAEIRTMGLALARRAAGETPGRETAIYLADTLGELGLFFRLARIAFIGGSLIPHGGQNPLEAAKLGCPPVYGPHMANFEEIALALEAAGGARRVGDAGELAELLEGLLGEKKTLAAFADRARVAGSLAPPVIERTLLALAPLLPEPPVSAPASPSATHAGP